MKRVLLQDSIQPAGGQQPEAFTPIDDAPACAGIFQTINPATHEPWTLKAMADQLGMTPSYLERRLAR